MLAWAVAHHVAVVPFGGGTSVVGGLVARREGYAGVVSLDLLRMDQLLAVDKISMIATLQPGVRGPATEALLAAHGLTLGHYPQSFEFASIGGFAATRSSGQSSCGNGRFDEMVVGLRVATPIGELRLGSAPANAAGPDLREAVLGSEGALGVITEVTVRVRPVADVKAYEAWAFPSFTVGAEAMRKLVQRELRPTVLRLSDEAETFVNLASQTSIGAEPVSGCLMIVGYEGTAALGRRRVITDALSELGGRPLGEQRGQEWAAGGSPRRTCATAMLDAGVLVETLETATFWSNRDRVYQAVKAALEERPRASGLSCSATSRMSTRPVAPSTSPSPPARPRTPLASGWPRRPRPATRCSTAVPRSPTTTPSASTTSHGWPVRSGQSASRCFAASNPRSTRPESSTPEC